MTRALLALLLVPAVAAAEPVDVGPAHLVLDAAWTGAPGEPIVRRHPAGAVLSVTVAAVGNLDAWRRRARDAYFAAIEQGFAATPGFARLGGKRSRVGKAEVPVIDLTFRRAVAGATEIVAVRVLLFRTVTIVATAAAPERRSNRKLLEAAVAGLTPDL